MATLTEVREKLAAKQKQMSEIAKAAGTPEGLDFSKVNDHGFGDVSDTKAAVELFTSMNDELSALAGEAESLKSAEDAAANVKRVGEMFERPDGVKTSARLLHPDSAGEPVKSLGELITEHANFKNFRPGAREMSPEWGIDLAKDVGGGDLNTGVKAIMTTAAGWAPQAIRTGKVVEKAVTPIEIIDLIPGETTNQNAVVYMEETTLTNAAVEIAEGASYPAAALALTERTSPVRKIAVYLPVTDEQLEDVAQVQAYINNRLGYMVRARLGLQALKGDGITPNLEGLQIRSGIGTYVLAGEPVFDAIVKGMDNVLNTGQATPDAVVINASDWWKKFRLARTPDGIYILGNPNEAGPANLWGLNVATAQQQTVGTALVGAYREFSGLAIKKNLSMSVGYVNDDFVKGQQSIRCEMRVALQCYRPAAFCKVTGL